MAAVYLFRAFAPRRFRSDRHFDHQVALAAARIAPAWDNRGWAVSDVPVGARDYLSKTLNGALGVLAMRIAAECLKDIDRTEPATTVEGSHLPFANSN